MYALKYRIHKLYARTIHHIFWVCDRVFGLGRQWFFRMTIFNAPLSFRLNLYLFIRWVTYFLTFGFSLFLIQFPSSLCYNVSKVLSGLKRFIKYHVSYITESLKAMILKFKLSSNNLQYNMMLYQVNSPFLISSVCNYIFSLFRNYAFFIIILISTYRNTKLTCFIVCYSLAE